MRVLLNDRLVPAARARISALDRGFLYGDGLFETVRTYGGAPFGLTQHLRRLARSARFFRIPFDPVLATWHARVARLLRANRLDKDDVAVRLTVSRGAGPFGIVPAQVPHPTTLMIATPLDRRIPEAQARGVHVCFFPYRLVAATLPSHKTLHYLPAVLGKMLARRAGAWEAIYLGTDDTVLEGTTSNLFAVIGNRLVTPPLRGILPGVTRSVLARIARHTGIPLVERLLSTRELLRAEEVFLSASTIEVLPVVRVDRVLIGSGVPGPLTRRLQSAYRAHVRSALRVAARRLPPRSRRGIT